MQTPHAAVPHFTVDASMVAGRLSRYAAVSVDCDELQRVSPETTNNSAPFRSSPPSLDLIPFAHVNWWIKIENLTKSGENRLNTEISCVRNESCKIINFIANRSSNLFSRLLIWKGCCPMAYYRISDKGICDIDYGVWRESLAANADAIHSIIQIW